MAKKGFLHQVLCCVCVCVHVYIHVYSYYTGTVWICCRCSYNQIDPCPLSKQHMKAHIIWILSLHVWEVGHPTCLPFLGRPCNWSFTCNHWRFQHALAIHSTFQLRYCYHPQQFHLPKLSHGHQLSGPHRHHQRHLTTSWRPSCSS